MPRLVTRWCALLLVGLGFAASMGCSGGADDPSGLDDTGRNADAGAHDADARSIEGGRDGDAAAGCRSNAECKPGYEFCYAPGEIVCGGPARAHVCQVDAECTDAGVDRICVQEGCGASSCAAKCTSDPDCGSASLVCALATGHCVPKPCTATSCPTDFVCGSDPAQGCNRKPCASDAECSGACVNGACYSAPGTCTPAPI